MSRLDFASEVRGMAGGFSVRSVRDELTRRARRGELFPHLGEESTTVVGVGQGVDGESNVGGGGKEKRS